MRNKITLTIGIPAYNDQDNIAILVRALIAQKLRNIVLEKIVVVSDGSTDKTVEQAKSIKHDKVIVITNKDRRGKFYRMHELMQKSTSDILIILDADVIPANEFFVEKLVEPIVEGKADLTSARVEEVKPQRLFEKILAVSMQIKKSIFFEYNRGNNIYTCHGRSRAFSKKLYKKIPYRKGFAGEDAYTYLYCIANNMKYQFVGDTYILYRLPQTIFDHKRQSVRFLQSRSQMAKIFGQEFTSREFYIPKKIIAKNLFKFTIKYPVLTLLYLIVFSFMKLQSHFKNMASDTWEVAVSTKALIGGKQ